MDELIKNSPELSKIKKENPFGVPKNYFDDFSARLNQKIEAEKIVVPKQSNKIIQILKPVIGLAASFALIFMLVYWPLKTFIPNEVAQLEINSEIPDSEIINVFEGLDENSFFAVLDEESEGIQFSEEDLLAYVSANFTDYEIYMNAEN